MKHSLLDIGTPKFKHDCECCYFLGRYKGYDLYVHKAGAGPATSTIARDGEDGEYVCGTEPRDSNPYIREARWRGAVLGLCLAPEW